MGVVSYEDTLLVNLQPQRVPFANTRQAEMRSFSPDLILLRSFVLGTPDHHDHRHLMGALFHHNVATVNSLESFAYSVEKEKLWGKMRQCRDEDPTFPLIAQAYYSGPRAAASVESGFPAILKVGSASQGVGKARVVNESSFQDYLSVLAMSPQSGFTVMPMVQWESDLRLQKIGAHYRAIRRFKTGHSDAWKANDAIGINEEDVPMEQRWKNWLDICSKCLKMDILGLDLLVSAEGDEYVLECNSSSIGFPERHRAQDVQHVAEVVGEHVAKLRELRSA